MSLDLDTKDVVWDKKTHQWKKIRRKSYTRKPKVFYQEGEWYESRQDGSLYKVPEGKYTLPSSTPSAQITNPRYGNSHTSMGHHPNEQVPDAYFQSSSHHSPKQNFEPQGYVIDENERKVKYPSQAQLDHHSQEHSSKQTTVGGGCVGSTCFNDPQGKRVSKVYPEEKQLIQPHLETEHKDQKEELIEERKEEEVNKRVNWGKKCPEDMPEDAEPLCHPAQTIPKVKSKFEVSMVESTQVDIPDELLTEDAIMKPNDPLCVQPWKESREESTFGRKTTNWDHEKSKKGKQWYQFWKSDPGVPDVGLPNLGNTCYLASLMQALSSLETLEPFLDKFYKYYVAKETHYGNEDAALLRHFCRILSSLRVNDEVYLHHNLETFYDDLCVEFTKRHRQDDAAVLFNFLFSKIKDFLDASPSKSLKQVPCMLKYKHVFYCQTEGCGHSWDRDEFSYILSVPIEKNSLEKNLQKLFVPSELEDYDCLKCDIYLTLHRARQMEVSVKQKYKSSSSHQKSEYKQILDVLKLQIDILDRAYNQQKLDEEKFNETYNDFLQQPGVMKRCAANAKANCTVLQTMVFNKLPKLLCIQFNRYSSEYGFRDRKRISFPMYFDSGEMFEKDKSEGIYSLKSVAVHSGGSSHGHYYAYRHSTGEASPSPSKKKSSQEPVWICCNDDHVEKVKEKEVESSKAYMLFYERE